MKPLSHTGKVRPVTSENMSTGQGRSAEGLVLEIKYRAGWFARNFLLVTRDLKFHNCFSIYWQTTYTHPIKAEYESYLIM